MTTFSNIQTKSLLSALPVRQFQRPKAPAKESASAPDLADRLEISFSAKMTVEAANGIVQDSVVEQINKALQEGGIDLTVEEARTQGLDMSPEAVAKRIGDFATGFLDAYRKNHTFESGEIQIRGFMSLTRAAIEEGFQSARNFLESISGLSEMVDENIDRTFELTQHYLDTFQNAQLERAAEQEAETAVAEV